MSEDHRDPVLDALRHQVEELSAELEELKDDLYSDERRRRRGLLERTEQIEKRQQEHEEMLKAVERREEERERREQRRARAVNIMLGAITTILTGFAVMALNQLVFGG